VSSAFRRVGVPLSNSNLVDSSDGQPVVASLIGFTHGRPIDIEVYRSVQLASGFATSGAPPVEGETAERRRMNVVVWFSPTPRQTATLIARALRELR
jgi:hypothetical protein